VKAGTHEFLFSLIQKFGCEGVVGQDEVGDNAKQDCWDSPVKEKKGTVKQTLRQAFK
jgi:hypothetical protein